MLRVSRIPATPPRRLSVVYLWFAANLPVDRNLRDIYVTRVAIKTSSAALFLLACLHAFLSLDFTAPHPNTKQHDTALAGTAGLGPGRIQQAFVFSLKEDMTEYYRLIAVLGAQLNLDSERAGDFSFEGVDVGETGNGGTEGLTLQRLYVWVLDPLKRLKLLTTLVSAAAQLKVGNIWPTITRATLLHSAD